jgi:hypothetical protein
MTATEEKKSTRVSPVSSFTIEADHPRNADLMIQCILGVKLRSTIKATKEVFDREEGEQIKVPAPAQMVPGLPADIPGMQLAVNPGKLMWKVTDPLYEDDRKCERITNAVKKSGARLAVSKIKGVAPKEGKLGIDEMKSLIREMLWLIESGEARVVKGKTPEMEDIEDLPGEFLTNPSKRSQWNQPRFEKDLEAWRRKVNQLPEEG